MTKFIEITVTVPDLDDAPLLMVTMGKALCEGMGDAKEARRDGSPYWWRKSCKWHLLKSSRHLTHALEGSTREHHIRNAAIRALMALTRYDQEQEQEQAE